MLLIWSDKPSYRAPRWLWWATWIALAGLGWTILRACDVALWRLR